MKRDYKLYLNDIRESIKLIEKYTKISRKKNLTRMNRSKMQ